MGFDFRNGGTGPKLPYDVSAFTGIQFDIKINDAGSGQANVRIKFPTYLTTPTSGSGGCASNCSDDFGNTFLPPLAWGNKSVVFASLTQEGWGTVAAWDPTKVFSCQWQFSAGGYPYDLSIDNVTFY
jgi:hypothetical protein